MKGSSGVSPLEGLGHRFVEVVDELSESAFEVFEGGEARPFEEATGQDAEPDLDLVQPGAMLGRVDPPDPVGRVFEEGFARRLRLEDAGLALDAEIFVDHTPEGDQPDEPFGEMGIQV